MIARAGTLHCNYSSVDFPTFSDNKKQPWFLDSGYLAGLSPGAVEFFERFRRVFEGRIAAAATFKNGDGRWIAEVKEFASAQGVDGSLLAKM